MEFGQCVPISKNQIRAKEEQRKRLGTGRMQAGNLAKGRMPAAPEVEMIVGTVVATEIGQELMAVNIVVRIRVRQELTAVENKALIARLEQEETAKVWMGTTNRNFAPCQEALMVLLICNDYS